MLYQRRKLPPITSPRTNAARSFPFALQLNTSPLRGFPGSILDSARAITQRLYTDRIATNRAVGYSVVTLKPISAPATQRKASERRRETATLHRSANNK